MTTPTGERLKAVETNLDNLTKMVEKLDGKFDAVMSTFVTQAYLQERLAAHETKITELRSEYAADKAELEIEIADSKKKNTFYTWITGILGIIFGGVLMILVQNFLAK